MRGAWLNDVREITAIFRKRDTISIPPTVLHALHTFYTYALYMSITK